MYSEGAAKMSATSHEGGPVDPPGLLFVWTDVEEAFEDDFNRWYDREHIEERVRIPGLSAGTRYRAVGQGHRYLGLYRTDTVEIFNSAAYRIAFESQTSWSLTNLSRMRDPMRRVCAILSETGFGTGAWLAVLRFGSMPITEDPEAMKSVGAHAQNMDGVISTRLLIPDIEKSTPLPKERLDGRVMDPILLIDATTEAAARTAADAAGNLISPHAAPPPAILTMMWQLRKCEVEVATP
jgi:hypothetical protein